MPKAIRATIDLSQGHCYSPSPSLMGSPDVLVNSFPVVRVDDNYSQVHCCGPACHQMGPVLEGSTTVFVNGKGIHRDGDKISCGDVGDNGSENVLVDEGSSSGGQGSNSYTDPSDPENTIGYTVKPLVLNYNLKSFNLIVYENCNKIYQDSWLSSVGLVSLVPEYYTPIQEEDTGLEIQDQTIPRKLTIEPPLPYPYLIDLNTAIISLTGPVTNYYSSTHTLTASNYVSEYFNEEIVIQFTLSASQKPVSFNTGSGGIIYFNCQ